MLMNKKQQGFSVIYVFLGLLILGSIAAVGWHVTQSNKNPQTETASKSNIEPPKSTTEIATDNSLVSIPEWKITVKPTFKESFLYSIDGDRMYFTTKELAQADDDCKLENKPHAIQRLLQPVFQDGIYGRTDYKDIVRPKKQASDGKYYFLVPYGAPCTYSDEGHGSIDSKALIESIEPIL